MVGLSKNSIYQYLSSINDISVFSRGKVIFLCKDAAFCFLVSTCSCPGGEIGLRQPEICGLVATKTVQIYGNWRCSCLLFHVLSFKSAYQCRPISHLRAASHVSQLLRRKRKIQHRLLPYPGIEKRSDPRPFSSM